MNLGFHYVCTYMPYYATPAYNRFKKVTAYFWQVPANIDFSITSNAQAYKITF